MLKIYTINRFNLPQTSSDTNSRSSNYYSFGPQYPQYVQDREKLTKEINRVITGTKSDIYNTIKNQLLQKYKDMDIFNEVAREILPTVQDAEKFINEQLQMNKDLSCEDINSLYEIIEEFIPKRILYGNGQLEEPDYEPAKHPYSIVDENISKKYGHKIYYNNFSDVKEIVSHIDDVIAETKQEKYEKINRLIDDYSSKVVKEIENDNQLPQGTTKYTIMYKILAEELETYFQEEYKENFSKKFNIKFKRKEENGDDNDKNNQKNNGDDNDKNNQKKQDETSTITIVISTLVITFAAQTIMFIVYKQATKETTTVLDEQPQPEKKTNGEKTDILHKKQQTKQKPLETIPVA